MKINVEEFEVVKPVTRKQMKPVLSVLKNGDFAINSELRNCMKTSKFEVWLKKDCTQILLIPNGKIITDVGKNNRIKNYAILDKLIGKKIKIPAYYVGRWNDENECWVGELVMENPNKSNKKVVK